MVGKSARKPGIQAKRLHGFWGLQISVQPSLLEKKLPAGTQPDALWGSILLK